MGTVRPSCRKALSLLAQVAELVDALASGASGRKVVGVQVSPWAPCNLFLSKDTYILILAF
jgi:hypothetical protein